jgi:hypothetical protein
MSEPHVISALRARRLDIAAQLHDTEKKVSKLRAALANLDAAMILLTPDHPDGIPKRRDYRRTKYFDRKELPRLALDALREAKGPVSLGDIALHAIRAKGLSESAQDAVMGMLFPVLRNFVARGTVTKIGKSRNSRWTVTPL